MGDREFRAPPAEIFSMPCHFPFRAVAHRGDGRPAAIRRASRCEPKSTPLNAYDAGWFLFIRLFLLQLPTRRSASRTLFYDSEKPHFIITNRANACALIRCQAQDFGDFAEGVFIMRAPRSQQHIGRKHHAD